jgi:hypothetical protein
VLRSHAGDDGATYSIDILYRRGGRPGAALQRYDFSVGSSSGLGKQAVVDRYPVSAPACFVDPATRRRHSTAASAARTGSAFGLPFFLAGAGGLVT